MGHKRWRVSLGATGTSLRNNNSSSGPSCRPERTRSDKRTVAANDSSIFPHNEIAPTTTCLTRVRRAWQQRQSGQEPPRTQQQSAKKHPETFRGADIVPL